MSAVKVKAKRTMSCAGFYEFTEDELTEKHKQFHRLIARRNELEAKKKSVMAEFKAKSSELDLDIEKVDNDINTGRRQEEFDCILYLDFRDGAWMKVFESMEYGHEVKVAPFDFAKDQHMFDFYVKRNVDDAVKVISWNGEEIMRVPMSLQEMQMTIEDNVEDEEEDILDEEVEDDDLEESDEEDGFTFPDDLEEGEEDEQ